MLSGISGLALAQPTHLDRGIEQLDEGLFEEALAELELSYQEDTLDRDALIQLLVHRALVLSGLGQDAEADLRRLGSLNPDSEALRRLPPPLRSTVDAAMQEPMAVVVSSESAAGGVHINVRVRGDVTAFVESFRIRARAEGRDWVEGTNSVVLPTTDERSVEYIAEALGPRGIVLVRDGTETDPTPLRTTTPTVTDDSPIGVAPPEKSRTGLWVGISLLVAALIAGGVATAIVLTNQDPSDTQVGMPMAEFP